MADPYATCGVCDWRLEGDDMEALKMAVFEHVQKTHPAFWEDWQKAIRNGHYFMTGEGSYER